MNPLLAPLISISVSVVRHQNSQFSLVFVLCDLIGIIQILLHIAEDKLNRSHATRYFIYEIHIISISQVPLCTLIYSIPQSLVKQKCIIPIHPLVD